MVFHGVFVDLHPVELGSIIEAYWMGGVRTRAYIPSLGNILGCFFFSELWVLVRYLANSGGVLLCGVPPQRYCAARFAFWVSFLVELEFSCVFLWQGKNFGSLRYAGSLHCGCCPWWHDVPHKSSS